MAAAARGLGQGLMTSVGRAGSKLGLEGLDMRPADVK